MVGVTLSLGGAVVAAAVGTINQGDGSAALAASAQGAASGVQLSMIYATVAPSGSCPTYQGTGEGTLLTLSLFDYGTTPFAPAEVIVNSTMYAASYPVVTPGTMAQFQISLGSCAHSPGLVVFAVDSGGAEVQIET